MSRFDGLDDLRRKCPAGSRLVGPESEDGTTVTVNGRVSAACIRADGTRHGPSITWYENGSKESEGEYREDSRTGAWTYWHDNGEIAGRGTFAGGKPDGAWHTFDRDGALVRTIRYRNGLEVRDP